MKKIYLIVALAMISVMSWATVSITVTPNNVDFGTVSIKGLTEVEGSITFDVTYSGLQPNCGVYFDDVEMPEEDAAFWISGTNNPGYIYGGDQYTAPEGQGLTLNYYAIAAGTYTGKIKFYSYEDAGWTIESTPVYMNISLVVTNDADVPQTIPFERIESTSGLSVGDTVLFVNEAAGAVSGALNGAYLEAITEGVTINNGHADVPENAQTFVVSQYGGNWQFTATGTTNKLLLDITGKGAFAYGTPVPNQQLAGWGVSISNGVAEVGKPDGTFPVEFNNDRFKPYKNAGSGVSIALYKKAGAAQDLQSSLEIEDIAFGDVENDELKAVTVNYTAANLTDDIIWAIEGADAALFDVADQGTRDAGTVTITYLGTSSKTGALDARLSYLTQDIALNPMEGSKVISINLIPATVKLTNLAFENAPTTIDQGQTIDLSQYVVYTPNNAADKSLTWSVDHSYQGEIDQDGKLTAYHVSGTVTVTATSVRVPSVSASITLTITTPTITDFTLSKTETTLNIGGQETLTITAFVPDYASASATWASSNAAVAKVNKNGVITAQALGDAVITATIGEVEKSCTVHVVAVTVNSIELPAEANLTIGSSLQLTPVVDPTQAASEYTITYESSAPEIATVSEAGVVHGVAEGDAVITATISDKSAQITIHVAGAQMFSKVTDVSQIAAKDTIILARPSVPVIAGALDGKKLSVLLTDVTVTETEAYADNALRMVVGTLKNKSGFTLQPVGSDKVLAENNNDLSLEKTTSTKNLTWQFVADGNNGIYVQNVGNTYAMFKYHAGNAAIKPYKLNTTGAVYVYAYVRKYVEPGPATGVANTAVEMKVQKVLRNGQVLIIRNGVMYDMNGRQVEK